MLKIKFLLSPILVVILAFSSCEKSSIPPNTAPEPEEEETINLIYTIRQLEPEDDDTGKKEHTEYSFLGFGYDITGRYAHKRSVREMVINIPDFVIEHPNRFLSSRILSSTFNAVYSPNAEQFTLELTNKFFRQHEPHDFSYFKGNITHPFPETDVNSSKYIYALYELDMRYRRLSLNISNQLLTPYITNNFLSDCEVLNASDIVEKYGTHILISLYTGAKLSLDYQAEYTGQDRTKAVENSFRIGLSECFGLFSGFLAPVDLSTFKDITGPKIAFEAIGGDPSKITVNETSETNPTVNTANWVESVTEENAEFAYLDGLNNLVPISEFIIDTDKKQKVEEYIEEYIKANEVKVY